MATRIIIGLLVGGGIGFAIGNAGKCATGACPLTGNPYIAAILGAAIGALLASSIAAPKAEKAQSEHVFMAGEATFDEAVSTGPTIVAFSAAWCGACRQMAPVFAKLADEYQGRVKFVKVDTDQSPALVARYGVEALPTLIVFRDGKPVGEAVEGYGGEARLRQMVEAAAGSTSDSASPPS